MSYLREQDDYRERRHDDTHAGDTLHHKEHELTLSSAAIFGIFLGQVVLCGIFFGFGYSMGGHRSLGTASEDSSSTTAASSANFSGFKPAAGQPAGAHSDSATPPKQVSASVPTTSSPDVAAVPAEQPVRIAPTAQAPVSTPAPTPVVHIAPAGTVPRPAPVAVAAPQGLWVQVAAISTTHPEDATLLQNALRAKGYNVSQHSGPDNFIHLLLGPFTDRPSAEAIKQRLATDGYTAYIK